MARLEIQFVGNNENLKQVIKETKGLLNDFSRLGFDSKPLTAYQAGLLAIKKEALELTKQREADRKAQQALNAEIKEQQKAQKLANDEGKKRKPTQVSNSQAEIDAYKKAQQGSVLYTSAINAERVARAQANVEAAKQAIANNALNAGLSANVSSTNQQTQAISRNVLSKKQLAQALAEEKLRQADSTKELKNNAREMLNAKGSIEQRRAALERLTTAYGRMSVAERQSASGQRMAGIIKDLGVQINKLDPTKIQKVVTELKKVPDAIPTTAKGNVFSELFSSISGGALSALAPLALLTGALAGLREVAQHNIEISDSFADVRRTAKLSADEVSDYAKEVNALGSRTNLEGLLDIGFIGGRLGVAKKDLTEFTKQVDELSVVLKKEFPGGAEAVAESLGKIVTIYKITQTEGISLGTALSKVGSNLLELAHSGPVTVKYLQDFTLGVAGTAASAKLSVPIISAYGAVLGESGQIASSAALSVTRLVNGLTTKTSQYAAIAQIADATLTVEKFTDIVNTDTKKALDLFFKGLKAGNPVATEFAKRLDSVGIRTGKVSNAVKILAENQDKLADRIQKGTKAFEEGTSVSHNFEIANNTLGASVDKLKNSIQNLTTNPNGNIAMFFKGLVDGATSSVNALSLLSDTVVGLTTDTKNFIASSARKSRNTANDATTANAQMAAVTGIKNLNNQKESLNLLKNEVKIRDVIQLQFLKAKIAYANIPLKDRNLAATKSFQALEEKFRFQIALVKALNNEYKRLYRTDISIEGDGSLVDTEDNVRTIDDIKADIKRVTELKKPLDTASKQYKNYIEQLKGFKKELAIANGTVPKVPKTATPRDFKALILSETYKSEDYDALTGLEGIDKTNEKTVQKYKALNDNLDKIQKDYNAKYKAGTKEREQFDALTANARTINEANKQRELTQNQLTFTKKQADIIAGIEDEAGITRILSQEQEIQQNDKHYADLTRQYEGNEEILATIVAAKAQQQEAIREKYRQERLEKEQSIQDKINDLTEKGFDATNGSRRSNEKLDKQLKERLAKVEDYYKELRKLNSENPMGLIALGAGQANVNAGIKKGANEAKDLGFGRELSGVASKFGEDLITTFTKANAFADRSFSDVISDLSSNLTDSLNQVFLKKFGDMLSKTLEKAFDSMSDSQQALAGGAILLGSVISGITKKTSYIGQGLGGALKGAGTGAVIGTAVGGPAGTVAGAVIGGVAGLIGGLFGAGKAKKAEAAQKAQLEEEKKQTALLERQNALAYSASIIGRQTTNGIVTGIDVNEFGQLITTISGQSLQIILDRANNSTRRGI